jgi:SAM-dependent methyltransferase
MAFGFGRQLTVLHAARYMWARVVRFVLTRWARLFPTEIDRLEAMVGPPGAWRVTQAWQERFLIRDAGVAPRHRFLDIGCGPLRGGLPLIRWLDPGLYVGVDASLKAIEEARRQVASNGLETKRPVLVRSDDFGASQGLEGPFDFVWCFQVLYHLDDALLAMCLARIAAVLGPTGRAYGNVNTSRGEGRWAEFPFVRRDLDFYRRVAETAGLRVTDLGTLSALSYPLWLAGHTNHLLRFDHVADRKSDPR